MIRASGGGGSEPATSETVLTLSIAVRDEMKGQSLSFIEIAKLVGERWQALAPVYKEPYETRALQAKERYNRELAEYRRTAEYRQYSQYLHDFKSKHAHSQGESGPARVQPCHDPLGIR